jgi:hypothetical protein
MLAKTPRGPAAVPTSRRRAAERCMTGASAVLHSYSEAVLKGRTLAARGLGGRIKANQTFRAFAKFLRAARAFFGDFERPPLLPISVRNPRISFVKFSMMAVYQIGKSGWMACPSQ